MQNQIVDRPIVRFHGNNAAAQTGLYGPEAVNKHNCCVEHRTQMNNDVYVEHFTQQILIIKLL